MKSPDRKSPDRKPVLWSMLVAWVLLLAAGCGGGDGETVGESASASAPKPNVVIVLVDALRSDRLGPYGFDLRPTTPQVDRFAAGAAVFTRVVSPNGWTVPSVASLFTGVDPQAHQVLRFVDSETKELEGAVADAAMALDAVSQAHETLAERFRGAGYQTAAFLQSDVISAGRGFDQGFDRFELLAERPRDRGESGGRLTDAAIHWLREERDPARPFFLYLHYMDVHASYMAPEPYYSRYSAGIESEVDGAHRSIAPFHKGERTPTEADVEKAKAYYDAEIEYWDHQFGRLLEGLGTLGLADGTVVALTADHGEAFYEHGQFFHSALYQENIRVPLMVRGPGVAPSRHDHWVEMMDLAPTLAELTGVGIGEHWTGTSHADTLRGGEPVVRPVYSEFASTHAVIEPETGLKLLSSHDGDHLYDLAADPGETEDLAAERPEDVARLKSMLAARVRAARRLSDRFPKEPPEDLTAEQIEQLKALGYLQ